MQHSELSPEMDQELAFLSRKILELNEKLQASESAKSRFLSLAAHELNDPMTILLGMLPHLKIVEDPKNVEIYNMMIKESYYLGFKIKNLVMAAQIESGIADHCVRAASIANLAQNVIDSIHLAMDEKQMESIYVDQIRESVMVDPEKVELILYNLLYNAVIYGDAKTLIEIKTHHEDGYLFLSVTNVGRAPAVEHKAELFTRFSQNRGGLHGMGIGLGIVREICEQFEGSIDYEVDDNKVIFTAILAIEEKLLGSQAADAKLDLFDSFEDVIEL